MRTAVTKSILLLGRYAVLPVAALAVAVSFAWFVAFDRYPLYATIALPVIMPINTVAIALAIGLLLPIRSAKQRHAVDERAASGLWAMWGEFDAATPRARRTLAIDPDLNASIGERRRYFALAHRDLTMTVGLPLLLVLDDTAVRAVVAHEVAHARLQHTTGGANLLEFTVAAANLFDHLDPERTISGRIAHMLLKSLLAWVWAEFHAIRYRNELEADREAGERTGVHEMARALVLLHHAGWGLKELILEPLDKELLGAIRPPTPPLQRVVGQLDAIRAYRATDNGEPQEAGCREGLSSAAAGTAGQPRLCGDPRGGAAADVGRGLPPCAPGAEAPVGRFRPHLATERRREDRAPLSRHSVLRSEHSRTSYHSVRSNRRTAHVPIGFVLPKSAIAAMIDRLCSAKMHSRQFHRLR